MRALTAIALVIVGFLAEARCAEHTRDSLVMVKKALSEGKAVLVDVRERSEWEDGHLKSAVLLPLSMLEDGTTKEQIARVIRPGNVVYLHCASGKRCLKAADTLKKFGYDVRPLKDGYSSLLKAGFPRASR